MTARRQRFLTYSGLVVVVPAMFGIFVIVDRDEPSPSLSVIPIKQLNQSGTNVMVFRLT